MGDLSDTKQATAQAKVTAEECIVRALAEWSAKHRKAGLSGALQPPMPEGLEEAAQWWTRQMQEPIKDHELGEGHGRYVARVLQAVTRFVDLPREERAFIVAARSDGVWWRGEPMHVFAVVYEETMRQREMGLEAYRAEAEQKMDKMGVKIDTLRS